MTNFGQRIPFGYAVKNGNIEVDENKGQAIKIIFEMYENGETMVNIIRTLDENFIGDFKIPSNTLIYTILKNKVYLGNDGYPQIIDKEIFNKAQSTLLKRTKPKKNKNGEKGYHPLSGKVFIAECPQPLYREYNNETSIFWRCTQGNIKDCNPQCKKSCNQKIILNALEKALNQIKKNGRILATKPDYYKPKKTIRFNQLSYKIRNAAEDMGNYNSKEHLHMIFEKAQANYNDLIIDDFSEKTEKIIPIIEKYHQNEINTDEIINQTIDKFIADDNFITVVFKNKVSIKIPTEGRNINGR